MQTAGGRHFWPRRKQVQACAKASAEVGVSSHLLGGSSSGPGALQPHSEAGSSPSEPKRQESGSPCSH